MLLPGTSNSRAGSVDIGKVVVPSWVNPRLFVELCLMRSAVDAEKISVGLALVVVTEKLPPIDTKFTVTVTPVRVPRLELNLFKLRVCVVFSIEVALLVNEIVDCAQAEPARKRAASELKTVFAARCDMDTYWQGNFTVNSVLCKPVYLLGQWSKGCIHKVSRVS